MEPDYRIARWGRNPYPKLCHAHVGDKVQLLEIRNYIEAPAGPIYNIIAFEKTSKRGTPGGCGLYGESRMLRLLDPLTSVYHEMPHLSTRVKIFPQDRSAEKMARHAANYKQGAGAFLQPIISHLTKIIEDHTMLQLIKSPHFQNGGTGLTNFSRKDLSLYAEAVRRYGDKTVFLSQYPMQPGGGENTDYYSLHRLEGRGQCMNAFWRVFEQVKKEREPEVGEMLIGGKSVKVTRTGDRFVIETDIGIESATLRFTANWRYK